MASQTFFFGIIENGTVQIDNSKGVPAYDLLVSDNLQPFDGIGGRMLPGSHTSIQIEANSRDRILEKLNERINVIILTTTSKHDMPIVRLMAILSGVLMDWSVFVNQALEVNYIIARVEGADGRDQEKQTQGDLVPELRQ